MSRPMICTSNTHGNIDYGVPLYASKSTDYRTSTGTYHREIPGYPEQFDCRVKARIKPELLKTSNLILNDVKSTYNKQFCPKSNQCDASEKIPHTMCSQKVEYVKTIQEKISQNPPRPLQLAHSEMKDAYRTKFDQCALEALLPSAPLIPTCEIVDHQRASQRELPPEEKGFWKYLDIYLTENRKSFVPYDINKMKEAGEDIITFYSGTGQYKTLKTDLPGRLTGDSSIYDKSIFREQYVNKFLSRGRKKVPNLGMQSEYQGQYKMQTYSDFYPYIQTSFMNFPDLVTDASRWQNLCPPGMYRSEYCHIGTGWPVRSVVDIEKEVKDFCPHPLCNGVDNNCEIKT